MDVPGLPELARLDATNAARVEAWARKAAGALDALEWAAVRLPQVVAGGDRSGMLDALVGLARGQLGESGAAWAVCWTGDLAAGLASFVLMSGGAGQVPAPYQISRTLVAVAVRTHRPTWLDDPRRDERFAGAASLVAATSGSVGCLPIGEDAALYVSSDAARLQTGTRLRLEALVRLVRGIWAPPVAPKPAAPVQGLIGDARPMRELLAAIRAFAPTPWPALVLGETGTGKEAVARSLHALSPRAGGPFVAVNCAAIPDDLAESTFFGHERGAFTGADKRREGLLERAKRGTLFLDEVGELSPRVQAKLLRVLQEGVYERLGGSEEQRFEGRIVAATLRALDRTEKSGFRVDLYHRLSACVLRVPALDARREDIPALATFLLERAKGELPGASRVQLGDAAKLRLVGHSWPGNVRELENTLRGALARAVAWGDDAIGPEHLDFERPEEEPEPSDGLFAATDRFQRERVREALAACDGNRVNAAKRLGVSRQWLYRLIARWGEP